MAVAVAVVVIIIVVVATVAAVFLASFDTRTQNVQTKSCRRGEDGSLAEHHRKAYATISDNTGCALKHRTVRNRMDRICEVVFAKDYGKGRRKPREHVGLCNTKKINKNIKELRWS